MPAEMGFCRSFREKRHLRQLRCHPVLRERDVDPCRGRDAFRSVQVEVLEAAVIDACDLSGDFILEVVVLVDVDRGAFPVFAQVEYAADLAFAVGDGIRFERPAGDSCKPVWGRCGIPFVGKPFTAEREHPRVIVHGRVYGILLHEDLLDITGRGDRFLEGEQAFAVQAGVDGRRDIAAVHTDMGLKRVEPGRDARFPDLVQHLPDVIIASGIILPQVVVSHESVSIGLDEAGVVEQHHLQSCLPGDGDMPVDVRWRGVSRPVDGAVQHRGAPAPDASGKVQVGFESVHGVEERLFAACGDDRSGTSAEFLPGIKVGREDVAIGPVLVPDE